MYLPTVLAPSVVPALLARAIERRMPAPAGPFALVDNLIIPLAAALPLDRSRLESWLAA
jgi:dolichol kinase